MNQELCEQVSLCSILFIFSSKRSEKHTRFT